MFFGTFDCETNQIFKFCSYNICRLSVLNLAEGVNIYQQEKPITFDHEK